MEDIESKSEEELKTYTLQQQYEYLVNIIKDSIGQFGDLNIAKKSLSAQVAFYYSSFFK